MLPDFLSWWILGAIGALTVYGYIKIISAAYHKNLKDDFPFDEE